MIVTLTSDFGVQSHGVALMESAIAEVAPELRVIHYQHGLPNYDTTSAARVLETVIFMMPAVHVCVCDPGVGTSRRLLGILTGRGDMLIGPDSGVLLPAAKMLGGAVEAREITNRGLMRHPVSPVFHGRDIFSPVGAHLASGVDFASLGSVLPPDELVAAPYADAQHDEGHFVARVLLVDKFGNAHLSINTEEWQSLGLPDGHLLNVVLRAEEQVVVSHHLTFGGAGVGAPVLVSDNDGRPSLSVNRGSFADTYKVAPGDELIVAYEDNPILPRWGSVAS